MNKRSVPLKWRFTILTIVIMSVASAILVIAINYDLTRRVPILAESILYQTENYAQEYTMGTVDLGDVKPTEIIPDVMPIDGVIGETVSNVYTTSIVAFFIIIIIGGITTYVFVNRALKPVIQLNDNIKRINENNLNSNLIVQGPHDEIKELTISFNKMIAKLDNAFASQKRFNSRVSHELKTPLAVIKTNIDVLNSKQGKSVEEYEETLAIVEKSVVKMDAVIESLLDLIKQENVPLNETIQINGILEDVIEDLSVIAMKEEIELDLQINEVKNDVVGNEILLYRALYNVVENAIKYNKVNGNVKITSVQEKDKIIITISDTGKGIEEEEYNKIFEPFYRTEGMNLSSNNGLGLGLSITKSIITMHGGDIQVTSNINKGTTFTVSLPC